MSNFERNVANTMLDAADAKTSHENTRLRQLTDAAAHWEHKYANARQYNRNLEERCQKLEAALRRAKELAYRPFPKPFTVDSYAPFYVEWCADREKIFGSGMARTYVVDSADSERSTA